jgi:Putative transposase/Transposase zinc-binding domain
VVEVADILTAAGATYRHAHASRLSLAQRQVLRDIEECRTAALGGHIQACDHCHATRYSFHSCRNRHCPKCQGEHTRRWLATQRDRLLPVPYYLLTFTLPAELRPVAFAHPKTVYAILMKSAASALLKLAADPKFLGADPGMVCVLHTWTRAMLYHPHAHFLVTAGGLSPDGKRWLSPKNPRFLVPGYALSPIFRAKVRDAFRKASLLDSVPKTVWSTNKKWVVHLKHAGTGEKVLEYLARYVFRIAIANSRIERFDNGLVTFRYRDNRTSQIKHCSLTAEAFIGRFLLHVLPKHFTKVRHYGVYSPSRNEQLQFVRQLLGLAPRQTPLPIAVPTAPPPDASSQIPRTDRCPACQVGRLYIVQILPRTRSRAPP